MKLLHPYGQDHRESGGNCLDRAVDVIDLHSAPAPWSPTIGEKGVLR